jgi:DNA-binding NarL/FixJ family response regulator
MFGGTVYVLVAEDDADLRAIVSDYLRYCGYTVWIAEDGQQALSLAASHAIDVAVLDVVMPEVSGIALIPHLRELWPEITIILLTAYATVSQAVEAMKLGALDYLEKPVTLPRLHEIIERAIQQKQARDKAWEMITHREREVLRLLAEGRSDAEIAEALGLSVYTANTHIRNLLTKLNVENRVQAALMWDRRMRGKG